MTNPKWEKVLITHVSGKGHMSRIYKEPSKLNNKITKYKNGRKILHVYFTKEGIWIVNKLMRRCSTSLATKEIQVTTTICLLEWLKLKTETKILKIPSGDEDVEQQELSHVAGRKAKWCSHFEKQLGKLNIHFPYNSIFLLLNILPKRIKNLYSHRNL